MEGRGQEEVSNNSNDGSVLGHHGSDNMKPTRALVHLNDL